MKTFTVPIPKEAMVILLGRGILAHKPQQDIGPLRLIPDVDVVLNDVSGSTHCVHCRRVEVETDEPEEVGLRFETVGCRNLASTDAPNGYLCGYHQRFLQPDSKGVYVRKTFSKGDVDASTMKGELQREVLSARQALADNEIHDHLTFERLSGVLVEEDTLKRYLGRG